jgi:hypothetical protein
VQSAAGRRSAVRTLRQGATVVTTTADPGDSWGDRVTGKRVTEVTVTECKQDIGDATKAAPGRRQELRTTVVLG